MLFQIQGTIRGKNISVDFANEIAIPELNIGERLALWNTKEYEISNLQLNIGDYTGVLQSVVKSLWSSDGDLILGLPLI